MLRASRRLTASSISVPAGTSLKPAAKADYERRSENAIIKPIIFFIYYIPP
jgi:hypothetical protein